MESIFRPAPEIGSDYSDMTTERSFDQIIVNPDPPSPRGVSQLLLPPVHPPGSEALSRELLYTAITRARQQFILHAAETATMRSIESLTQRHSGLAQKLGWPD